MIVVKLSCLYCVALSIRPSIHLINMLYTCWRIDVGQRQELHPGQVQAVHHRTQTHTWNTLSTNTYLPKTKS